MFLTRVTASGRCLACGEQHAACGGPSDAVPADQRWEVAAMGGPLKRYRHVTASGVEAVSKLSAGDAERLGLTDADLVDSPEAESAAPADSNPPARKGRAGAENKARTRSANKAAGGGGGG